VVLRDDGHAMLDVFVRRLEKATTTQSYSEPQLFPKGGESQYVPI
jgi:hypothetical protein